MLTAVSLLAAGCGTQTPVANGDAAAREIKIKPGDRVAVLTTRRESLSLDVVDIGKDRLVGVTVGPVSARECRPPGERVEVPVDELAVVRVVRADARAAVLTVGIVVVTLTAMGAVLGAAAVPALPAAAPIVP